MNGNGTPWQIRLGGLALVLVTVAAWSNSLRGPFVFDDVPSIVENTSIRSWGAALLPPPESTTTGRPLTNLSFAVNFAIRGFGVYGFHAINLAIHAAAALLLFGSARRLMGTPRLRESFGEAATGWAAALAALWLVHPLQTAAVTAIVQRAESLAGFFYLLTVYCGIRAMETPGDRRWSVAAVGSCLLGVACKETVVTAPLAVLLVDRTFFAADARAALGRRRWLYLGLVASWLPLGWLVADASGRSGTAGFGTSVAWSDYALTQIEAIGRYLRTTFWPARQVFDYGTHLATWSPRLAAATAGVLVLGAVAVLGTWRRWVTGFCVAWFLLGLAPTSLVPVATQTIAEHRMYLPLAGVMAVVVGGLRWLPRRAGLAVAGLLVGVLAVATQRRNEAYQQEVTLWRSSIAAFPANARAHHNLADALAAAGDPATALAHYEAALALEPGNPEMHNNHASALAQTGAIGAAIAAYGRAAELAPLAPKPRYNLGLLLAATGRLEEAAAELGRAVELEPKNGLFRGNLANVWLQLGRPDEAARQYEESLRLDPTLPTTHYNYAGLLVRLGRAAEAEAHYRTAVERAPDYVNAWVGLGQLLARAGRNAEAVAAFREVRRLQPDSAVARAALAELDPAGG